MNYRPLHADPIDQDEWDGPDPTTALEDALDRKYAQQDARRTTVISTNRINRKYLRDSIPQQRRRSMAMKAIPGTDVLSGTSVLWRVAK